MTTPRGFERRILFFTCAGHTLTHVMIHLFTPIQREMRDSFELSDAELTGWASISVALFGAGALPAGWLGDRFGEKPLLVAFYALSATGALVIGSAQTLWQLGVGFALVGLGTSIYHPVGLALISKGLRKPGWGMGINGLFGSLGTALSPVVAVQMTQWTGSWRWAFLGLVAPTVVLAIWMATSDLGGTRDTDAERPSVTRAQDMRHGSLRLVVTLLLLAMACGGVYYSLIITKMPDHLSTRLAGGSFEDDLTRRAWIPFLVYAIGGLAQVLFGHLVSRRDGRGLYVVILAIASPLILAVGVLGGGVLLTTTACAMSFFMFAVQPVENTLLARYSPPRWRGLLYGLKFVVVFGAGMGIGTWLSGTISERHDLGTVFVVASGFTVTALLFAVTARIVKITPRP